MAGNFRNLSVKQLAKASTAAWNDATALAEILTELRRRAPDGQIEALIRSNVRRLSTLTYRPIDQANETQRAPEDDGTPGTLPRRRRRRILLAALFSGAAAGVIGVLLTPPREPPPPAETRQVGPQTASAAPPPASLPAPPDAEKPGVPYRAEPMPRNPQPRPSEPRLRDRTNLATVESEAIRFQLGIPRHDRVLYPAEAGIRIGPQQFHCFVGNNDPRRCAVDAPHEMGRASTQPRAQAPLEPRVVPAKTPVPSPPTERNPYFRERTADNPMARAAGALTKAAEPVPSMLPQGPETPGDTAADDCAGAPGSRLVFVMDGSLSMGLPANLDPEIEDRLDHGIRNHDEEARQQYRALLAEPGPKRISRAGDAFDAAARTLPSSVELGLVAFRECRDIRTFGVFNPAQRPAAIDAVRNLVPHGRTPLAESLRRGAELLDDGPSSIVMLTDGREFCGGDPCAAAAEIKAQHRETSIHVVDLGGQARAECVAQATGGRSYSPAMADDLGRVLAQAFRGAVQCPATAGNRGPKAAQR